MTQSSKSQDEVPLETSIPQGGASLESILCTEELQRRPSRAPDCEKENLALVKLVSALADSPSTVLQTLADTILDITECDSAGLSLLTRDGKTPDVCGQRFYWPAIAGMWKPHIGKGTPRNFGPCGDVLDQNRTLLFKHFERRYPYFEPVTPVIEECLLVPFYVAGEAVGTIWAIMHSQRRKFDAEDDRVMASLGKFASSAYQSLVHIDDLKIQVAEREKAEAEVRELARGLEAKIRRLVEANVVGIVMWNLEGTITGANDAFLRMVQYDREDLASGRVRWTELTPAEWRERDERAIADLKATGIVQPFEKEYFRKDGSRVSVLLGGAFFEGSGNEGVAFVLDLTEQKRMQEKLRESETLLQAFLGNTPNLVFLKDRQGRYLYINRAFTRAFPITEEQIRGKTDDELFSAEQAAVFQANDRQVLQAGVPMEFEELFPQQDGQHIGIIQKFPLFNAEGEIYAIGGIVTDITERKREESARRYSEERYRVVVEAASDAVISMDENGAILLANAAALRIFGYDPVELIGKPLTILMPELLRKLYEAGFKDYLASGQRHINWQGAELTGLRKNGQEFPVEISFGELIKDGHRIFTGFVRDISERKRAELALRRSESYLAEAQRLTHTGSWAGNILTRKIFHSSDEHSRLYGIDPDRGIPSFEELYERIHPDDRARLLETFQRASRAGSDVDVHYRIVLPDGTTKYVEAVGHPIHSASGETGEFVGFLMDVTERRRAEEERERLRQAQADLAYINRISTMGELAASLAHEIKQPISAAMTDARTCSRWLTRDRPDLVEAQSAASRVVKDVARASEIIGRVRSLFKKDSLQREEVDINELIQEMIALLRGEASRHSILMHSDLSLDLPPIMADRVQVQQVLMNLMLNSIEAMKSMNTPGKLSIRSQQDDSDQLLISVMDTGVGVPPEKMGQIFNAFFTSKPQGTGMGLPISRSIIESHGGRLWAVSNPESGATFHFTLPIQRTAHQAA